jgi:hypothetical protein
MNGTTTRRSWVGAVLWGLLAAAVLAVDVPVLHHHDGDGLYNQDCPLARLATGVARGPVPDAMAAARPLPARESVSPIPWIEPALPAAAPRAARAPPLAVV